MIPRRLKLRNFLSYHECEVDFMPLRREAGGGGSAVAVLWGRNGSGKSSLLEAISWSLWKEARAQNDEDIVRLGAPDALVEFEFDIGKGAGASRYLVIRKKSRGKSGTVDFFQVHPDGSRTALTGSIVAETQRAINEHVRMDYDTFISSAFIAQGRANEFTKKKPAARKEVFRKILGLEQWEAWSKVALERRKSAETDAKGLADAIQSRIQEVEALPGMQAQLASVKEQCDELAEEVRVHEAAAQELRDAAAAYAQLAKAVRDAGARGARAAADAERSRQSMTELEKRLSAAHATMGQAASTREGYEALQTARAEDERLTRLAQAAQSFEKVIQQAEAAVQMERVRIESDLANATREVDRLAERVALLPASEARCNALDDELAGLDARESEVAALQSEAEAAQSAEATAKAEMEHCKSENRALKAKQDELEGKAECPLCRTPLGPADADHIRAEYSQLRKALGERYNAANAAALEAAATLSRLKLEAADVAATLKRERATLHKVRQEAGARLAEAMEAANHLPARQAAVTEMKALLADETFATREREVLAKARAEFAAVEYDRAVHDGVRRRVQELAPFERQYTDLLVAEGAIEGIEQQITLVKADIDRCEREAAEAAKAEAEARVQLDAAEDVAPRLQAANEVLAESRSRRDELMRESGRLETTVERLRKLQAQVEQEHSQLEAKKEEVAVYKDLESAFGRDGVQTMLIEQALPELEDEANRRLAQMTTGRIAVQLRTEKKLQSGVIADSLEIRVSDDAGTRDYAMYSGGEAFRVDFALRIALARLLARRAGAELPTLIIDEGFGSQDAEGIDRLVEAINAISGVHQEGDGPVHEPFELILVVTHVEELRERFERRIEVSKDPERGSRVRVV